MARAIKQPISACPATNALRGKRIVAPPRAQKMPISMGPTRKEAGTATRSSTRARISDAQTATAHWRAGRIDPKVHLFRHDLAPHEGVKRPLIPAYGFMSVSRRDLDTQRRRKLATNARNSPCRATANETVQGGEQGTYVALSRSTRTDTGSPSGREAHGDGAVVVVRGRESRPHGEGPQVP